ncbi:MAG: DUF1569 domain-containing protein [Candidatus Hydrogenedentes bacterium]|nr:DUF1569 domain-containing protein [Candidatus Hydrogenedentota bacterium]
MAERVLTRETLGYFQASLARLKPDSERRFGTMDARHMMRHMRLSLEASLGLADVPDKSIPVVSRVVFWTICNVVTKWPGGKLKAPAFWTPPAEDDFEGERRKLLAILDQFIEKLEAEPKGSGIHPIFGRLTMREWSRLIGLHFRHHFRQFGVE